MSFKQNNYNSMLCNFQSRGSTRDGTGVHDSIVNQLLTKVSQRSWLLLIFVNSVFSRMWLPLLFQIDGVEALNNVLLIGMTNRKDLLDEALLRYIDLV